jgi:predicted lipid-binding transport protein (Tim44 family)
MEGSFPFLEIVLFAMVAGFLILRLRSVLGRRTGNERRRPDPISARTAKEETRERDTVVPLPERPRAAVERGEAGASVANSGALADVAQIRSIDRGFDPGDFVAGARRAFEMIVEAFASGDSTGLRPLLSDDVFAQFDGAIRARSEAGHSLSTTLVGIREAEIVDAGLEGKTAQVTVKFVSEQINVTRDREGRVVDGDPSAVTTVTDIWTFARNIASRDPNWVLVATRSPA